MKVTKDKGTTIVEISGKELSMYNVTFQDMDCSNIHTRAVIRDILSVALRGEKTMREQQEIILLPDCFDGCVIVCKEREKPASDFYPCAVSCSSLSSECSEIFCSFFF